MYLGMYSVENENNEKIWDVVFFEKQESFKEVCDEVSKIINKLSMGKNEIAVKDFNLYKVEETTTIDLNKLNDIRKNTLKEMERLETLFHQKDLSKENIKEMMVLSSKYPGMIEELTKDDANKAEKEVDEPEEAIIVKDEVKVKDEAVVEAKE
jgi:hypothetical protein